jgi:hypothetical protein
MRWNPIKQPYSVHGHLGDYDNLPEVYLAKCITNSWYDHRKILYKPHMYDLLNGTNMLMNETQIYDGLRPLNIENGHPFGAHFQDSTGRGQHDLKKGH